MAGQGGKLCVEQELTHPIASCSKGPPKFGHVRVAALIPPQDAQSFDVKVFDLNA